MDSIEEVKLAPIPIPRMISSLAQMHGLEGDESWIAPVKVTDFDVKARWTFSDIKADEYCEDPIVLQKKVEKLAKLITNSKNFIVYTGAGISTAAGIDDYASKAKKESITAAGRAAIKDWKMARPTYSHRVLTTLQDKGYLQHWIQQNHDSLPQKAGYPQHALNEIHGSLHDPANPIVPYEGTLRGDLLSWMHWWQENADLCLALGTSMSGFNCDSVPVTAARKYTEGKGLGLVIVNLQQTPYDERCTLRIYEKIDVVMELLAKELKIQDAVKPVDGPLYSPTIPKECLTDVEDVFRIPFNSDGRSTIANKKPTYITWDLRVGKFVKLTGGPYAHDIGTIMEKNADGHYRIRFEDSMNTTLNIKRRPFSLWLGSWWLQMAAEGRGNVPGANKGLLPFVNVARREIPGELPFYKKWFTSAPAINLTKYQTMKKIGMAEPVIRQKMMCDNISAADIDVFFADSGEGDDIFLLPMPIIDLGEGDDILVEGRDGAADAGEETLKK